jgi:hypothetical protein
VNEWENVSQSVKRDAAAAVRSTTRFVIFLSGYVAYLHELVRGAGREQKDGIQKPVVGNGSMIAQEAVGPL